MEKLNGSQKTFYNQFAQHGTQNTLVEITPKEVALLAVITALDLNDLEEMSWIDEDLYRIAQKGFYSINERDIRQLDARTPEQAFRVLQDANVDNISSPEYLYMINLSALYRRRVKYRRILKTQPFPTADQIAPRCLLEYEPDNSEILFSWMMWRKLAYDLDNRTAQEAGYLFEPILTSCLGGISLGANRSPVKRLDDNGDQTDQGRQIDCLVEAEKRVYELKMRITIAASGQGRFKEELSFPAEASAAGLTPILVVFDPTPSSRLEDLQKAYKDAGGESAIGEQAWALLRENAEEGMATFIEKYIEPPIVDAKTKIHGIPESITLSAVDHRLTIRDGEGHLYESERAARHE